MSHHLCPVYMCTAEKLDNVFKNVFRPQSNKKKKKLQQSPWYNIKKLFDYVRTVTVCGHQDIKFGYTSPTNIQIWYLFWRCMFFHCQIDFPIAFILSPKQSLLFWVTMKTNTFCIWFNQAFDLCLTASIQDVGNYKGS